MCYMVDWSLPVSQFLKCYFFFQGIDKKGEQKRGSFFVANRRIPQNNLMKSVQVYNFWDKEISENAINSWIIAIKIYSLSSSILFRNEKYCDQEKYVSNQRENW